MDIGGDYKNRAWQHKLTRLILWEATSASGLSWTSIVTDTGCCSFHSLSHTRLFKQDYILLSGPVFGEDVKKFELLMRT